MRALAILLQSFKVKFSDYKTLGAIILFPILLTMLFSYVFTNVDKNLNEGTVLNASSKQVGIKTFVIEDKEKGTKEKPSMATTVMVTMFIFSVLMGSQYGVSQMTHIRSDLGKKLLMTPVSKGKWYVLEGIASFFMILLQGVLFVSLYEGVFRINLLKYPVQLGILVSLLALLAISIGSAIGAFVRNGHIAEQISMFTVMGLCFLTGGFTPMMNVSKLGKLSPVTYIAKALFELIEGKSITHLGGIALAIISISLILIGATYFKIRKEEAI